MKKQRSVGRPKMAEKLKKVRFSVTLKPNLLKAIEDQSTIEKGRNALIEETLRKKFL